jgi:hypothetical protein
MARGRASGKGPSSGRRWYIQLGDVAPRLAQTVAEQTATPVRRPLATKDPAAHATALLQTAYMEILQKVHV